MSTALVYSSVSGALSRSCKTSGAAKSSVPTRLVGPDSFFWMTLLDPKSPIFIQMGSFRKTSMFCSERSGQLSLLTPHLDGSTDLWFYITMYDALFMHFCDSFKELFCDDSNFRFRHTVCITHCNVPQFEIFHG